VIQEGATVIQDGATSLHRKTWVIPETRTTDLLVFSPDVRYLDRAEGLGSSAIKLTQYLNRKFIYCSASQHRAHLQ
jgi:hypothetical protein